MNSIGIDSISFYIPEPRISVETIITHRLQESQKVGNILQGAQRTTEQEYFRIPQYWQDSVCLAAQSLITLFQDTTIDYSALRYLISGTETPVDASKPNSSFLLGILSQIGINMPRNLINYQIQHACAGGTIGLLQVAMGILQNTSASGIVSMGDIALYDTSQSAEITQGAGAVSLYIKNNPRLLEIDLAHIGYFSDDVDDFFRPLSSCTAKVKGRYSMECYIEASYQSLLDYAQQIGMSVEEVLDNNDYIVFHTPFASMPVIALSHILKHQLSYDASTIQSIITRTGVQYASEISKYIGNTYTSSTYFSLGYILQREYNIHKEDLIGKTILLFSYGSGNTAVVFRAKVAKDAGKIISTWNLHEQLNSYCDISFEEYNQYCHQVTNTQPMAYSNNSLPSSERHDPQVYLKNIRAHDLYREYGIRQ